MDEMHYHILLTELCNSECRYCYGKSMKEFDNELDKKFKFDFSAPQKTRIEVAKLKKFLLQDKEPVLIFYGGEPLLEIPKIMEIMDTIGNKVKYRMQTNGKFLDRLYFVYLEQIDKILISLDGDRERTDYNRGEGTYDLVMNNIEKLRKKGYKGELIARMTITPEFPDLYKQVLSLISAGFSSVHWQLDAGFYKFDYDAEKFKKFVIEYNNSVSELINYWIKEMEAGKVIRLYPFVAIVESLLKNEKTLLRCGAGHSGYAITTNGKVVACPIMNCIKDFEAGTLENKPEELKKLEISGRCLKCNDRDLCGGRCLYWNQAGLWPEEGDQLICHTIKHLIKELKEQMPKIQSLINSGKIKASDFDYEKYFGPEIIP